MKFPKFHVANGTEPETGNFPVGYISPVEPNRSIQIRKEFPEIYDREVLETEFFSNGTLISVFSGCSDFPKR